jgi:hypothetical protein
MKGRLRKSQSFILLAIFLMVALPPVVSGEVRASYLYNLSDFTGPIPLSWVGLSVDRENNEVYVISGSEVRVFNKSGMGVYSFGNEGALGAIYDATFDNHGNIIVLSYEGDEYGIISCNFRGEPVSKIEIENLPPEFSPFRPTRIEYRDGRIYLADKSSMRVAVTDARGFFEDGYDIASLIELGEKKRAETGLAGFTMDGEGNILFTVSALFKAFRLSPDRKITWFGDSGSLPGKFGVVAGIASDDKGFIYVADTLRCVVMVFDKDFTFQKEFGYRGPRPHNLIGPKNLATDGRHKLYVSQTRRRGVSVFEIGYD